MIIIRHTVMETFLPQIVKSESVLSTEHVTWSIKLIIINYQ